MRRKRSAPVLLGGASRLDVQARTIPELVTLAIRCWLLDLMQLSENGGDLIKMLVEEDEARGEAETVEHVGELDTREGEAVVLSDELACAARDEFLVSRRENEKDSELGRRKGSPREESTFQQSAATDRGRFS